MICRGCLKANQNNLKEPNRNTVEDTPSILLQKCQTDNKTSYHHACSRVEDINGRQVDLGHGLGADGVEESEQEPETGADQQLGPGVVELIKELVLFNTNEGMGEDHSGNR